MGGSSGSVSGAAPLDDVDRPRLGAVARQGVAGNHCGMNFRLLAPWPSKDILPTSVACDTACETLRHYRRMRKNRQKVLIIDAWEGAGRREISHYRLERLAKAERAKRQRPKRRNSIAQAAAAIREEH